MTSFTREPKKLSLNGSKWYYRVIIIFL